MRLLVHAAGIACGGGLRHLAGLLPALEQALPPGGHAWFTVRTSVQRALEPPGPRVGLVAVADSVARSPAARLALDNIRVPSLARRYGADVLVSLANFGPVVPVRPHLVFQTNATYFDPSFVLGASAAIRARVALRRRAALLVARSAGLVVTPSEAMCRLVQSTAPGLAGRCVALPHGISRDEFRFVERESPQGRPFVFLCPAVAAPYKGLDWLVSAAALLRDDLSFEVRAHGNDADWPSGLDAARRRIAAFGMADRFRITPDVPQQEMARVYADADALVHPSACESFGFTLLEALATGLPVVAADIAINREIATDAAVYYDPGSQTALAAAMRQVASDASLRTRLTKNARRRLEDFDWSWKRYAHQFLALCERVMTRR